MKSVNALTRYVVMVFAAYVAFLFALSADPMMLVALGFAGVLAL